MSSLIFWTHSFYLTEILRWYCKLLMKLAKQQIKLAFEQAEKEVHDLHQRIAEGMRESKAKGNQMLYQWIILFEN